MHTVSIEPVIAECRIYAGPQTEWDTPHVACMNLHFRPQEPGAVDITMNTGAHNHSTLRALMQALIQAGVKTVYAHRRDGHRLPGAARQADGTWRIDLLALQARQPRLNGPGR